MEQNNISDIELNIVVNDIEEQEVYEKDVLRIPLDHVARRGNWTGSQFKNLMSCDTTGGKMDWFNKEKVFRFSEGAIKYIFANAMERKTGRYLTTDSTKEMKYGTKVEPLIFKRAGIELAKKGLTLEQVGFKTFPNVETAGVTSDSVVRKNGIVIASFESKACSSWTTLYDRTYELTHDKSTDFWQTQGQTFAWEVEETYYCVISPVSDINKYLYCEDIMQMYDEWCAESEMHIEIIKSSPIHLKALERRIIIAEAVVKRFLEDADKKYSLKEILYEEIDYHRQEWNESSTPNRDLIEGEDYIIAGKEGNDTFAEDYDNVVNYNEPEKEEKTIVPQTTEPDMDNLPF